VQKVTSWSTRVVRHCARWIGKTKIWSYRQSERKHIYAAYAEELIKNGWAYYAFDSSEALEQARKEQEEKEHLTIIPTENY
jgi:glutamyl/glutaminyl-tRNA synthetase